MEGATKVAGKTVIRVHALDNSMKTLLVDDDTTAQSVVTDMCQKLGLKNYRDVAPCYSIHECTDGVTIGPPLADGTLVVPAMTAWPPGDSAKFVFTVKLYMESQQNSTESRVVHMHYIQAVYNVICGIYPTSMDEAVSLAALQVQAKFGDHNPATHKLGYLSHQLKGLIPGTLIGRKSPTAWETEILSRHALLTDDAKVNPELMYTTVLKARDYYGCSFHVVTQAFSTTLPRALLIGISARGVFLLRHEDKATLDKYSLGEIYRWGFKPGKNFYFEVKKAGGGGPCYVFDTGLGNHISDHLTDYAMMLLRELGISADGEGPAAAAGAAAGSSAGAGAGSAPAASPAEQAAAIRIQALYRGYLLRNELHQQFAATRLQAITRGFLARCRFDRILEEMERELDG